MFAKQSLGKIRLGNRCKQIEQIIQIKMYFIGINIQLPNGAGVY